MWSPFSYPSARIDLKHRKSQKKGKGNPFQALDILAYALEHQEIGLANEMAIATIGLPTRDVFNRLDPEGFCLWVGDASRIPA